MFETIVRQPRAVAYRLLWDQSGLSVLCGVLIAWSAFAHLHAAEPQDLSFNRDIRPILSDRCFACHGPDDEDRHADLRLDVEEAAKGFAILPGNAGGSELMHRILAEDPELRMPPVDLGKGLTPEEVDKLKRWIDQGAPYEPFWAYVPPQLPAELVNAPDRSPSEVIDELLSHSLKQRNWELSPPADPVTLIRRLAFDLTGLAPTREEVEAFTRDPSPTAYEALIDRYLASDHYGERMAVYWLDLVRYADTVGYHGDQDHHISPYRDWVIDAFNENLPFDQFTREQLAGDLLPDATVDQQIATGYNRLLQTSHEGGVQPQEYLAIYAADRVRNLSAVWMGATVGCAQCHHHKYDPYTIEDFYSLAAFFADVDEAQHFRVGADAIPTRRPPEIEVHSKRERARLADLEQQLTELFEKLEQGTLTAAQETLREALIDEREELLKAVRKTMVTVAIEPREMRVLPRGNWLDDSGPLVEPAYPQFLTQLTQPPRMETPSTRVEQPRSRLTRLNLANWLTDPDQGVGGLTARVQVNRFWYLLFGTGISRTLDDFGGQGEPPLHPELLDFLAVEFIHSGWDVKHLLKSILLSRAYQQSSVATPEQLAADPDNQWFARQGSYRLPAEFIRDHALAVSGLLNLDYGGGSARPYQPTGYYRHLNFPRREYAADKDVRQYRRGVYVHWQRQFLHPMLKAFDAPSREECTAQRPRSNTPLAALVLLNDPSFLEAARVFAERLLREGGTTDAERLNYAFQNAVSRSPDEFERNTLQALLTEERQRLRNTRDNQTAPATGTQSMELLKVGLEAVDEQLDPQELLAWTAVTRAILNLHETYSRN